MTFVSHDSTPNQGLSAKSQAPRELGDSQKFLEKCDARGYLKPLQKPALTVEAPTSRKARD
jgi:hypothetical protein